MCCFCFVFFLFRTSRPTVARSVSTNGERGNGIQRRCAPVQLWPPASGTNQNAANRSVSKPQRSFLFLFFRFPISLALSNLLGDSFYERQQRRRHCRPKKKGRGLLEKKTKTKKTNKKASRHGLEFRAIWPGKSPEMTLQKKKKKWKNEKKKQNKNKSRNVPAEEHEAGRSLERAQKKTPQTQ